MEGRVDLARVGAVTVAKGALPPFVVLGPLVLTRTSPTSAMLNGLLNTAT